MTTSIGLKVGSGPREYELEWTLSEDAQAQVMAALERALAGKEGEVRCGDWVLYFKERPAGNRLLAAHPDLGKWVGTLALTRPSLEAIRKALVEGNPVAAESLGEMDGFSNFHLQLVPFRVLEG